MCPNLSKFVQTGVILSKLVEIYLSEGVFFALQGASGCYLATTGYYQIVNKLPQTGLNVSMYLV